MPRNVRLLLDTNLWSYIGDAGGGRELFEGLARRQVKVVLAPGMLLELARNPRVDVSGRHVAAMLSGHRTQLASEAELQCAEISSEISRLRPEWLLTHPDHSDTRSYHRWWTIEIWRHARRDWPSLVQHLGRTQADGVVDQNVARQKKAKETWLASGVRLDVNDLWASLEPDAPEWIRQVWPESGKAEAWRAIMWGTFRKDLLDFHRAEAAGDPDAGRLIGRTWADWLGATVDLDRMLRDLRGLADFWLREVDAVRMARTWLVWAVDTLQLKVKIGRGNAGDVQHAQHLLDADVFLTADARYANVLRSIADLAPRPIAAIHRVSGGMDGIVGRILGTVDSAAASHA